MPPEVDADTLLETLRPHLNTYRLTGETARQRAASVGRVMTNLSRFLHLVGFIAVLLGGVGVASAIQVYIKDKRNTVAILRCIGARAPQALAVYVLQAAVLGAIGAMVGGGGWPRRADLPPVPVARFPARHDATYHCLAGSAARSRYWCGVVAPVCPLAAPLGAAGDTLAGSARRLRERQPGGRDPWRWGVLLLLVGSIGAFAFIHTERWTYGAGFCAALGVAFGLLTVVAKLLMRLVRTFYCHAWPYVWRQGLANLYRPQNQTLVLVLALGLGTFLAHDALFDPADAATSCRTCRCCRTTEHDFV